MEALIHPNALEIGSRTKYYDVLDSKGMLKTNQELRDQGGFSLDCSSLCYSIIQSLFLQTATTTAPPQQTATPAESLQVDLLPVLAAAQETAAAAAVVAAATASAPAASTVDTAALKQQQPSASEGGSGQVVPPTQTTQAPTPQAAPANPQASEAQKKPKSKGPYICSLCAKEFKNGYNLRRHEAIHTGAKASHAGPTTMKMPTMVPLSLLSVSAIGGTAPATPAPAEGTGNTAGSGAGLVTTTASGKRIRKNHACEMCGKAFRDVYHLNRHKLSHSDEKPYQCPVCQQRFKRKDRMSYHVRSHDGAVHKPYICSHCGKSFSRYEGVESSGRVQFILEFLKCLHEKIEKNIL
ncbi:myc-associated zinc finger protein-like, partial [Notechis scutatus]|uniref:Myc-associated zinc finger protein n=1 Tax=Notechis scutatus TaxID=8663 RepID=A0A6J1VZC2_9SAUR